ncbi:MAG: type II secretion system GspH family protein [Bacteroidales bacterium]|nr:type II secretion system GspH family protein [Bacteroidales bacterium]
MIIYNLKNNKKGFTLIELLIVIAVIAVISAVVFIALDPLTRFKDARDTQRWSDLVSTIDAIKLYQIDNSGHFPSGIDENWRMLGTDMSGCDVDCGGAVSVDSTDISVRVISSTDDAEERDPPGGFISRASTDLELVDDDATEQEVGIRFQSINIPNGATVNSVYIEFTVDEVDSGITNLVFYGQDIDDADNFSDTSGDISSRTKTSANVSWSNILSWDTVGETKTSSNLAPIVQEIINRAGWSSGNDIVFIITGSGERTAEAYDSGSLDAPLLLVNYSTTTSSGGITLESACLDLSTVLSSKLSSIPYDPSFGSSEKTYYAIQRKSNGILELYSCSAEGGVINIFR